MTIVVSFTRGSYILLPVPVPQEKMRVFMTTGDTGLETIFKDELKNSQHNKT